MEVFHFKQLIAKTCDTCGLILRNMNDIKLCIYILEGKLIFEYPLNGQVIFI